jgi:hypothetical protein
MEFADGYIPLYRLPKNMEYFYMSAFLLLRLAIETGYSQADFHTANIMINTDSQGYFKNLVGDSLLIDYGYAVKIPEDILNSIERFCESGRYTTALRFLCTVDRSDGFKMDHEVYGYFCGTINFLNHSEMNKFPEEYNKGINKYFNAFQNAIREPNSNPKLPSLPLPDNFKQYLYSGFNKPYSKSYSKSLSYNTLAADADVADAAYTALAADAEVNTTNTVNKVSSTYKFPFSEYPNLGGKRHKSKKVNKYNRKLSKKRDRKLFKKNKSKNKNNLKPQKTFKYKKKPQKTFKYKKN